MDLEFFPLVVVVEGTDVFSREWGIVFYRDGSGDSARPGGPAAGGHTEGRWNRPVRGREGLHRARSGCESGRERAGGSLRRSEGWSSDPG